MMIINWIIYIFSSTLILGHIPFSISGDVINQDHDETRNCPSYVDSCIYVCDSGTLNPCHPENLYPIEIENYLLEHPGVLEVAVFGLPDKKYDEECCAVARVDLTIINNPDELRDWCKERISRWKVPRYIFFIDSFPVTPSGKIQKYKLQEQYIQDLNLN